MTQEKPLFEKIHPDAITPTRATKGSAGYDLHAIEYTCLHNVMVLPTGLRVHLPPGTCGLLLPRSGLAVKEGITLINSPGLIDEDYEGEIKVPLWLTRAGTFMVTRGMRIAQFVVVPYRSIGDVVGTVRGAGGFGSTGTGG